MLCRIFHSQGVQTLQPGYHTAQGGDTGFTAAGRACTPTLASGLTGRRRRAHVGAHKCLFVLICAVFSPPSPLSLSLSLRTCTSVRPYKLGLELGAPNSVAAKVQSAAVPANDV